MTNDNSMNRRTFLTGAAAAIGSTALAGCSGGDEGSDDQNLLTQRRFTQTRTTVETSYDHLLGVLEASEEAEARATETGVPLDTDLYE
ncbi:MAG: twin-arginine translocation signal domain-containing protein, partial [Candidatus Nanohaloarchaea archaeon]